MLGRYDAIEAVKTMAPLIPSSMNTRAAARAQKNAPKSYRGTKSPDPSVSFILHTKPPPYPLPPKDLEKMHGPKRGIDREVERGGREGKGKGHSR